MAVVAEGKCSPKMMPLDWGSNVAARSCCSGWRTTHWCGGVILLFHPWSCSAGLEGTHVVTVIEMDMRCDSGEGSSRVASLGRTRSIVGGRRATYCFRQMLGTCVPRTIVGA
jgi:hypothetical protein